VLFVAPNALVTLQQANEKLHVPSNKTSRTTTAFTPKFIDELLMPERRIRWHGMAKGSLAGVDQN
jgi:hypothetical protein